MQREHLYLQDIIEASDMIQTFLERMDVSTFLASELRAVGAPRHGLRRRRHPPEAHRTW